MTSIFEILKRMEDLTILKTNNNNNTQLLPLLKSAFINLILCVILIIYVSAAFFVVCRLFIYHMKLSLNNKSTYQKNREKKHKLNFDQIFINKIKNDNSLGNLSKKLTLHTTEELFKPNEYYEYKDLNHIDIVIYSDNT